MNANELANELDNMLKAIGLTDNRVPTMLRQQQAEIESLKKEAALQRLSDFTQEADNEPVGVVTEFEGILVGTLFEQLPDGTKLYTHPASLVDWSYQQGYQVGKETHLAKTLTNEEILDIWYEFNNGSYDWTEFVKFARAILRKAQEK